MRDSFVFHADYIAHLPKEYQQTWAMYTIKYGLYEKEPQLSDPLHAELWRKIKVRIDADAVAYTNTIQRRSVNYAKGHYKDGRATRSEIELLESLGWIDEEGNLRKTPLVDADDVGKLGKPKNTPTRLESDSYSESYSYSYPYSYSESDCEYESVNEGEKISPEPVENSHTQSIPTEIRSIFETWSAAELPNAGGDEEKWLHTEWEPSIQKLEGVTVEDIEGAVKNYISVLRNEDCFLNLQYSFSAFTRSKSFRDFLPDNFRLNNFLKYDRQETPKAKPMQNIKPHPTSCPHCGAELVQGGPGIWACPDCSPKFFYEWNGNDWVA